MKNNLTVKLLICYHKPDVLFKDDILTPIHVGRAQAKASKNPSLAWMEENMIGDDTGDHISDKNYCYNELTAPYWAWKNYENLGSPDYIGLMHYRRHFIFDKKKDLGVVEFEGLDGNYLQSIQYSPERVRELVSGNDIVYYRGQVSNIYEHYRENHKIEDLELALKVIDELSPSYSKIAKEYVSGNTGCFCNMAIFSKEMFFEYCEWLYPILNAVFACVDMSEKRFFISERLTGIFIAKKIEEGRRALPLATSFVHAEYRIPVALPLDREHLFETAVTMQSFLINAKRTTHIDFYLLADGVDDATRAGLECLLEARPDFGLRYVDVGTFCREKGIEDVIGKDRLYPFLVSELVGGKCLYVTRNVIAMRDIEEFFRLCSVDDFWICGTGVREADGRTEWMGSSCVINTKRMKDHKVFNAFVECYRRGEEAPSALIEAVCHDQFALYADWFWVNANEDALLVPKEKKRTKLQNAAVWHPLICYTDAAHPTVNIQATYANFWWNVAGTVTAPIPFDVDPTQAIEAMIEDQKVMNELKELLQPTPKEPGIIGKILRYYRQFGFKATVKRFKSKVFGG